MKRLAKLPDIRLLIAVFFLLGLANIRQPPIDKHDWRQTLTLSIAHNFLDHPNIFYPRMDIGGNTNGVMACEFPLYNYLLAATFKLFGVHDWYGRLLNWTISCIGLWFFYGLIRKCTNERTAFFALLAMMASLVFEYARKSMPDTFAMFVTLSGVWFWWTYLQTPATRYLLIGFVLVTAGILSKIPFVILLSFLLIPMMDAQYATRAKNSLLVALSITLLCVGAWYFYWMPYLLEQYGNQLIWPVSLQDGWKIVMEEHVNDAWSILADTPFHSRISFLISIMGLGLLFTGASPALKWCTMGYLFLFFMFTLKTGIVFPTHEYYVIPLIPMLSLTIGLFWERLQWGNLPTILLAITLLSTGFVANEKLSRPLSAGNRAYLMRLPAIMDRFTQPSDKIMVNNGPFNPTMMYWAQRKGWTVNTDVPAKTDWMPDFRRDGLRYILVDRHLSEDTLPYRLVYEDVDFRLYGW